MNIIPIPLTAPAAAMNTEELRRFFMLTDLFKPGQLSLHYWEVDRALIGGAVPAETPLQLTPAPELRAEYVCERREIGIVNLGGGGTVKVDGKDFKLGKLDGLYVGRGSRDVVFSSADAAKPARFYLLSYLAHANHPTTLADLAGAEKLDLGNPATSNERKLCKLIHAGRFPTCQVVMGVTILQKGSVWNTMPAHTHLRRSEVYLYFDVPADQAVFHFMGEPSQTRHIIIRDGEAALSPPWSIHCGCGTSNYGFVWGMGGENQDYTDMDPAPVSKLL
ncbi:MAG TPA: 5-dehydro-4-deoxy-D-glucuronate isomerase [Opitutaceae bacterium]